MPLRFERFGTDIGCPMIVNTGSAGKNIYLSKDDILDVNYARETTFIFDIFLWYFLRP